MTGGKIGPIGWRPAIGQAIGQIVEAALVESLRRLAPRWLALADAAGHGAAAGTSVRVDLAGLVLSHPMDRAVGRAMCTPGVFDVKADAGKRGDRSPAPRTLRKVTLEWQGHKAPELWNWVRALSPTDATVEDVAAELLGDSAESYLLTAAPPLFAVPTSRAKRMAGAAEHAPAHADDGDASASPFATLAGAPVADEMALAQAGGEPKRHGPDALKPEAVVVIAGDCMTQATYLASTLAPWKLEAPIVRTLGLLGTKVALVSDPAQAVRWGPVLAVQKANLAQISGSVGELDRAAGSLGIKDKTASEAESIRSILATYADAAATSHLATTSRELIARAARQQAGLVLTSVQSSMRGMNAAVDTLRDVVPLGDNERKGDTDKQIDLNEQSRILQSRLIAGQSVSADDVDALTLEADTLSLRARVRGITEELAALEAAAHESKDGIAEWVAAHLSGEFSSLEGATHALRRQLSDVVAAMDHHIAVVDPIVADVAAPEDVPRQRRAVRRATLTRAERLFNDIARRHDIAHFLSDGADQVKWQAFRTGCVKIAALLGISLVGGVAGGMVARAVGGMLAGTAGVSTVTELGVTGQLIAGGTGLVTETAINAAGQSAIFGGPYSDAFLENLLMSLGSRGALKLVGEMAAMTETAGQAARSLGSRGGKVGFVIREGTAITGHTIMGAALGYVADRMVTGKSNPPPETLEEWLLQGASIAVGRYVGGALEAHLGEYRKFAQMKSLPRGAQLLADANGLRQRVHALEGKAAPALALEILERHHQLLTDEARLLDELEESPERRASAGMSQRQVNERKTHVHQELADVNSQGTTALRLQLAGLEELVPGAIWKGTRQQIDLALRSARASGVDVETSRDEGGVWHVQVGERVLVIHETPVAKPDAAKIGADMQGRRHAGIELHSHFLGNVDPVMFRDELARSGMDPMREDHPGAAAKLDRVGDVSSWEPLLREIASLESSSLAHKVRDGKIAKRGEAGDAILQAKEALDHVNLLKKRLARGQLVESETTALRVEIDKTAQSAVDKALRASDVTDFNSSYAIRDELVKKFYGGADRNEIFGDTESVLAAQGRLAEHFRGRPEVMERVQRAAELQERQTRSAGLSPTETAELKKLNDSIRLQFAYDRYTEDTLVRLAQDKVSYSEQSNSLKKMCERFDPGELEWARDRAKARHPELAADLDALVVKHLAMINTAHFGVRDAPDQSDIAGRARSTDEEYHKEITTAIAQAQRPDAAGIDIAGSEHFAFDAKGRERFTYLFDQVAAAGRARGEPIVLRPHVGEGANDVVPGEPFGRDHSRQVTEDGQELTHYRRARENIEAWLQVLERIAARPENLGYGGRLPPEVIVRFGHVTHATPDQAERMVRLGVIAEVNLTSNAQTGAIARNKPLPGEHDRGRLQGEPVSYEDDQDSSITFDDHSLGTLVFSNADIVLSTDAHSVMNTALGKEYQRASITIKRILNGHQPVRITVAQARKMNLEGGSVSIPHELGRDPGSATIEVTFKMMSPDKQALYQLAYVKFYKDAHRYYNRRPNARLEGPQ